MATKVGSLLISLGLDSAQFKSGLTQSERQLQRSVKAIERTGERLKSFGAKMSLAVSAPLVALGKKAVDGFLEQERAMADVTAALKSMGDASGKTAVELGKTADRLELNSLFDAEVILKQVTAQLLTFGNIAGEQFDRAQQAAVDMAARLGTEPQAAAIMLGKALNDPIKGLTALTRVGVSFTQQQQAQIKALVKSGDTIGAQKLILAELEKEYRGAAAAAADASPWRKAQVAIGQAMDQIGKAILPAIKPVAEAIGDMARAFAALPEPMQKLLVVAAAVAAVLGPLVVVAGALVSAWAPFIALIGAIGGELGVLVGLQAALAGIGAALAPIALPVAAIAAAGALIYANWGKIAPVLEAVAASAEARLAPAFAGLTAALQELWRGPLGDALRAVWEQAKRFFAWLSEAFGAFMPVVELLGKAFVVQFQIMVEALTGAVQIIGGGIRLVAALLTGDWADAWQAAQDVVAAMGATVLRIVEALVPGIRKWLVDKLDTVWSWIESKVKAVAGWFQWLYDDVVGNSSVPDLVDGVARHMARLEEVMVEPAKRSAEAAAAAMRAMASDVETLLGRLFPAAAAIKQFREEWDLVARAQAAGPGRGGLTPEMAEAARSALMMDLIRPELGSKPSGPDFSGVSPLDEGVGRVVGSIEQLGKKAEAVNARIVKSFGDMARDTLATLDRLAGSIKGGGFLDILSSVLGLAVQLGSIGVFGKSAAQAINAPKVPSYAGGTNFHPGGLALVGERGPELVAMPRGSSVTPNDRLAAAPTVVQIVPSPMFEVVVDGKIQAAAGPIMIGGANVAQTRMQRSASRRVA